MQFPFHLPQFTDVSQLPSVYVKMRAIDCTRAEHREILIVCGWAPKRVLDRSAGHTPTHSSFPILHCWHGRAQTSGGRFVSSWGMGLRLSFIICNLLVSVLYIHFFQLLLCIVFGQRLGPRKLGWRDKVYMAACVKKWFAFIFWIQLLAVFVTFDLQTNKDDYLQINRLPLLCFTFILGEPLSVSRCANIAFDAFKNHTFFPLLLNQPRALNSTVSSCHRVQTHMMNFKQTINCNSYLSMTVLVNKKTCSAQWSVQEFLILLPIIVDLGFCPKTRKYVVFYLHLTAAVHHFQANTGCSNPQFVF